MTSFKISRVNRGRSLAALLVMVVSASIAPGLYWSAHATLLVHA
jgi:hypothetical protein